jgi:hypothetical protein
MNIFEYTLLIQEVDKATTLKKTEEILRKVNEESYLQKTGYYYGDIVRPELAEEILLYKVARRALNHRTSNDNLPLFITEGVAKVESGLMFRLSERDIPYETLMDTFEFTEHVKLQNQLREDNLIKLIKIVGENKMPCTINYNLAMPTAYGNVWDNLNENGKVFTADSIGRYGVRFNYLFYIEDIKRQMPEKDYTIIEDLLGTLYNNAKKGREEVAESAQKLIADYTKTIANVVERMMALPPLEVKDGTTV